MADELRLIRGDTYDLVFDIIDSDGAPVPIVSGSWHMQLSSEVIDKNSVDDPGDFIIETSPYTTGQGLIHLSSEDTDPADWCGRAHYKIQLYKDDNPAVIKTVATGDFIFIDEA